MEPSSPRWSLNALDMTKWGKNTIIFLAPVLIIYLASIIPSIQEDGLQVADFAITNTVSGAMALYVINVVLDILRKLTTTTSE